MNDEDLLALANNLYDKKEYFKAIEHYKNLAMSGNYGCARRLGWMYLLGEGVDKNFDEALKWLFQAASQNDNEALFAIGWLYLAKKEKNWLEAYKWFEKSAENNFAPAIYRLAWIHKNCKEYSKEPIETLLVKAAKLGSVRAKRDLGLFYLEKDKGIISKLNGCLFLIIAIIQSIVISIKDVKDPRLLF